MPRVIALDRCDLFQRGVDMKFVSCFLVSASLILPASKLAAEECPSLMMDEAAARQWSIVLNEDEWMHQATLLKARSLSKAKPSFFLEADGPVDIEVLGWDFPDIYGGRVGVLHYYSGAAGTHAMANFSRVAVIDLLTSTLITNPIFSTEVAGTRYVEQDDGSTLETQYYYCDVARIAWFPDRFEFTYDDETSVYVLSGSDLY